MNTGHPRRLLVRVVGVAVLLAVGLVLWAAALGLDDRTLFAQLSAFRVQIAGAVLVVGLVVALVPWRATRLFGVALVLLALSPLPQILPRVIAEPPAGSGALTVLSLNVFLGRADPADVAALAVDRGADVVALPEASAPFAAAVVRGAAVAGVEYLAATDGPAVPLLADGTPAIRGEGPYPTSLLVRADRRPVFRPGEPRTGPGSVTAQLPGARPVTVVAVHTSAPLPGAEPAWRADHDALAQACAAGGPLVLAGDFNSTLDQSPLRDVLAQGCGDAAEATGQGLRGTWPARRPSPLRIVIDHVLLTPAAGTVATYDVVAVPGTDHRGLVVTIAPFSEP